MAQILYLTGQSATLYRTHRKGAVALARFACTENGYGELIQWLKSHDPQPLAILADLIEEEFREEALPHTRGSDRTNLHLRQAGKLFRGTPFRYHRVVGRKRSGRRDDRVLFSALTNRDNIEPLLNALVDAGVAIKGVYSLPIITRRLLKSLGIEYLNVLIVTEQPDGGLRETFLHKGRVHFSRLAPVNDRSPADYCQLVKAEVIKTRRYLNSLRLLPPTESLEIYTICDSARIEALQAMLGSENDLRIHSINLSQAAGMLGFPDHPDMQFSDALFCFLLQTRITGNHYAAPSHLQHWQTFKAKLGLRAATWLLAVGASTLSGMNFVDGLLVGRETGQIRQVSAQVRQDYQQAAQSLPVKPDEAAAMREALRISDRLGAHKVHLKQLFSLLGGGFTRQPIFTMDQLDWFVATNPDAEEPGETQRLDGPLNVTDTPYLVTLVKAHVRRFNGSYRQAHDDVESLAEWLRRQPGVKSAEVVSQPLNTRTDADIQGGIATSAQKETAKFEIRIVTELKHEPV